MKTKTLGLRRQLLAVVTACAFAPSAFAATLAVNPATATGTPGAGTTPATIAVQGTGDGATVGFQVDLLFDHNDLSVSVAGANGGNCSVVMPGRVRVIYDGDAALNPMPNTATSYCNLTFTVDGAVTAPGVGDPDIVYLLELVDALYVAIDMGNPVPAPGPHNEIDGEIRIQGAAPDVTLSYTPAPGTTVTFPGGTQGQTVNQSITVNGTGTSGSGQVTSCAVSGAGAAAFAVTSSFPITVGPGGSDTIDLTCQLGAAAASATLTCVENDADSTDQNRTWTLSCPVGGVAPVRPSITGTTPADGGTVAVSGGLIGSQGQGTITFQATGGAGTGADATTTINCVATSPVTVTPTSVQIVGSATSGSTTVRVPLTGAAQSHPNSVTCTVADGPSAGASFTWNVTAPAGSAFVPPEVIPSASTWSKIALFGLLGLFGLIAVGFRRNG